jgi:uncharacterized repeat protein (TIGR01451 family)
LYLWVRVSEIIAIAIIILISAASIPPSVTSSTPSNISKIEFAASYYINGTVYLYAGTYAGGYNPLVSTSGAPVTARWFDSGTSTYRTISTTTNAIGFFSVTIYNCTDGSLVELKARFVAPYNNWGYNYTYVDFIGHPGGRIQNVVCGVPYSVVLTVPVPLALETPGISFPATYVIRDRDGSLAQGYFTFANGPMEWSSSDITFVPPVAKIFNGVSSGGSAAVALTLFTGGIQWINISEGGSDEFNPYLTPWGNFNQIINGVTSPGWKDDWEQVDIIVLGGGGFDWRVVVGWNIVSCPMTTYERGSNGYFDAYDALKICHWQLPGGTQLSLLKRVGGNPSNYSRFDYGMSESLAFPLDGVHSYWVYSDVAGIVAFNGTAWPAGANVLTLSAGWNMVGFTHTYTPWTTTPTAQMWTNGAISPTLGLGVGSNTKIIASQWNDNTQSWISYVATSTFPGIATKNWQWDFTYSMMPGNGLMLWVQAPTTINFNTAFGDSGGQPESLEPPIIADVGYGDSVLSSSQIPQDPYPIYGWVYNNYVTGSGYDVYVKWTDKDNKSIPTTPLHEVTNTFGQYSVDLYNHVAGSKVWENATKTGYSGHNSTIVNMADPGKYVDIWNDVIGAVVTLDKTGPATANPGETITYTISYQNLGTDSAYNSVITDTYPASVTFVSAVPAPSSGNNVWNLGSIPVGGRGWINITVSVNMAAVGTLVNYAVLTYNNAIGIPQPPVNDTCSTVVLNPCMVITKEGPANASRGEIITYWLNYTNIGTDWAYNVVIAETYPIDVSFISAMPVPDFGDNVWLIGAMPPGGSGSILITVQVTLSATGNLTNWAYIDCENGIGIPIPQMSDYSNTTIGPGAPLMVVDKKAPATAFRGDIINYWINYSNIGTDWAYNVAITENYPPEITFFGSIPAPSIGNNIWMIGSMAPGSSASLQITVLVNPENIVGTVLTNNVTLDYEGELGMLYADWDEASTILLRPLQAPHAIAGYVKTTFGTPLLGVIVTVTNMVTGEFATDITVGSGTYQLDLGSHPSGYLDGELIEVTTPAPNEGFNSTFVDTGLPFQLVDIITNGTDTSPPEHLKESPPVNGESFNLTPVISVDVTDISGVNASTIRLYVNGFMIFYDLAAISDGYTVSYWHESGFTDGQNVTCRIVAKDYLGNKLDFTWTFTATLADSFTIALHDGWNLISFAMVPTDTSVKNLLSSISGNWDVVKWYDPTDVMDPWKTYRVGSPNNDLADIDNTMGFWLHVTDSTDGLIIYGNEPVITNILLKAGWNLVSYPSQTEQKVSDALWGTGADHVEAYDGADPELLREMGPNELMQPGKGYWVHVPADSVWTVNY